MDDEITFDYICEFFYDAYIKKNSWKAKEFFNNAEMVKVAKECYPMVDISWDNRRLIAYLFRNRKQSVPNCANPNCMNYVTFNGSKFGNYCSTTCSGKINYEKTKDKIRNTNMERYGAEHPSQSSEIKNKIKQTNLEKYGVEYGLASAEIQHKIKQTNTERYGVDNVQKIKKVKDKVKKTNTERYGVDNVRKSPEIREKIKQTNIDRYGTEYGFQSLKIQDKIKKTNLERHGTEHALSSVSIQDKIKQTNIEKYGVAKPLQNKDVYDKLKQTNIEKYGFENVWKSSEIRKKIKQTNIEKYGFENVAQNKEVQDKIKKTHRSHYNSKFMNIFDTNMIDKFKELLYEHGTYELAELVNCDSSTIHLHAKKHSIQLPPRPRSYQELQIVNLFDFHNINFVCNDRSIIAPMELDFYLPDHNIAIEINGVYWHSEKFIKDKNYHYNKWKLCQDKGINLYSIFEDDLRYNEDMWFNKILHLCNLSKYDKIHARKCSIQEVSGKDAKYFLNKNHLQGSKYSSINLGLYYNDDLVSIMSFSNTRNNNDGVVELTRFCNKMDTQVVGGASRLLSYFIKKYGDCFNEIISFSDNTYSDGSLYEILGFDAPTDLKPDYKYVVNDRREHKTNYRKSKIQQKFKLDTEFAKSHTEKEMMDILGIYRIWDCGKKKWTMNI